MAAGLGGKQNCAAHSFLLSVLLDERTATRLTLARCPALTRVAMCAPQSTYTGVYAKGGPNVVEKPQDLAALIDRSDNAAPKKPAGAGTRCGVGSPGLTVCSQC